MASGEYLGYSCADSVADDEAAVAALLEHKTIASVEFPDPEFWSAYAVTLRFTDGSAVSLMSWDYEGYSSGLYVFPGGPRNGDA